MTNNDILARNALLLGVLDELEPHLKKAGIEIMLLKGAACLELGIFGLEEREMTDLDLLVKPGDLPALVKILGSLGFGEMPESSAAYYRTVKETLPPLVVDLHTSLRHEKGPEEVWPGKIKIRENVYAPPLDDLLLFSAAHPVLHHGFFDERAARDFRKILGRSADPDALLERTAAKAATRGVAGLFAGALAVSLPEKAGKTEAGISAREFFFAPLIKLSFKRHYAFNEYLLPFLYRPSSGFRLLFPDREFMRRRHGSAGLKNRIKRILGILLRATGIRP
ncbi:MAG: hypothetical protein COT17_02535 [Elusimicrobia bacterium CG08_land_8_20_14_0_20_51_18]|nr:MAG: hypothetical protein COT17_02535 [Elusimicrobia bacterium CG08_land_8_20_14_0_20_51_18]